MAKSFEHGNWVRAILTLGGLGAAYAIGMFNLQPQKAPLVLTEVKEPGYVADKKDVTVHIVGAVKSPGLYTLPKGSRINDAILAAGGKTAEADIALLNLAEQVEDGAQIEVPAFESVGTLSIQPIAGMQGSIQPRRQSSSSSVRGSTTQKKTTSTTQTKKPTKPKKKGEGLAYGSISINSAGASQLQLLPGIGPATASNIIGHRRENGPFRTIDDLIAVRGIGPKKLEAIRRYVRL